MTVHKMCTRWKQNYRRLNWKEAKCHEAANSVIVAAVVKPHILDQSNKEVTKVPRSWSGELDKSSKVLKFLSRHTVHIRHIGIKFQMWEWCLPNQLYHCGKKERHNSKAFELHYNAITNGPQFPHHNDTYNTTPPSYTLAT